MISKFKTYFAVICFSCLFVFVNLTDLTAQDIKSNTKGFSVTLNGTYGTWSSESQFMGDLDSIEPNGLGAGIKISYGINQNIELLASLNSAGYTREFEWDIYQLTQVNFGGRYNFGATLRRFRPFLEAGLSINSLIIDPITFDGTTLFRLESSGAGISVGGGFHIFLSQNISVNASGNVAFGNFGSNFLSGTEVNNLEEILDFTITTVHIGLSYFFH